MIEKKTFVLYEESLGINFNGYPVESIDEEEIIYAIRMNRSRRLRKNVEYAVKLIVREIVNE